uniref:Translation initiation factor eIF2B subunit epsilon n=1 Tax=Syphacia muris TaxID=451379 RepID=A0A0N5ADX0_9BILA
MVKSEEEKQEPALKAVIVADCFDSRFLPVLDDSLSWGSLRVANVEILHYTLEWLSRTDIRDVIVASVDERGATINRILEFWTDCFTSLKLISCKNCMSVGDVIREIDGRSLITSEFLLITNPASFCAISLRPQIKTFFERRKDKNNVMTLLYAKRGGANPIVCLEKTTNRLVFYHRSDGSSRIDIDKGTFIREATVRSDIQDTGIALCSPVICSQFSDNFDFQYRDDIIREILVNEEILCQNIHVDILPNDAAAFTVSDYEGLLQANTLILQRWLYPLIPSRIGDQNFMTIRNNVYVALTDGDISQHTFTSNTCLLNSAGPNVVFGTNCSIDSKATIKCAAVGDNCFIGENSVVISSIIGNNVKLGKDVKVFQSFIADNVIIEDGAAVGPQSIIGHNVLVQKQCVLAKSTICAIKCDEEEEGIICAQHQCGYEWKFANGNQFWHLTSKKRYRSESSVAEKDLEKDRNADNTASNELNTVEKFLEEVKESMERIAAETSVNNQLLKNLILEINSSKLAYNVSMDDVAKYVFLSFLMLPQIQKFSDIKKMGSEWRLLFHNYFKPIKSQIQGLLAIEEYSTASEKFRSIAANTVHFFYELDVFDEKAILDWYETVEENVPIKQLVAPIIKWLNTADEEDDSE